MVVNLLKILKQLKHRKGFTLVELLAVIVVLGIISVIGYSVVGNVISGAQESADKENVRSFAKSVQLGLVTAQLNGDSVSDVLDKTWLEQYAKKTGNEVECSSVVNDNGSIILAGCIVGADSANKYCYNGNDVTICNIQNTIAEGDSSNAASPNLLNNNLTPVVYAENYYGEGKGSWVVADTTKVWYNYDKQEWANAVILESGVTKNVGDPIIVPTATSTSTEVKAMYVWIPRYSYTIKSENGTNYYGKTLSDLGATTASKLTPGAIDIKFVSKSTYETGNALYTGSTASNWRTHPAFGWDDDKNGTIDSYEYTTGIWIGKFETTGTLDEPSVLPNLSALTNEKISVQSKSTPNIAEFEDANIHMMKNSEWGAAAYLSQSKYGKYGNTMYSGTNKEIYQNKSDKLLTGNSNGNAGGTTNVQCTYDDIIDRGSGTGSCGGGASSTGNIYGIYGMSGGANEHVSSYATATIPEKIYPNHNFYTSEDMATACNGGICYGHALSETKNWYNDYPYFSDFESGRWAIRGGNFDSEQAGAFSCNGAGGGAYYKYGFRTVLLAPSA